MFYELDEKGNYCKIGNKWYKCCDRICENCMYYLYDVNEPSDCYLEMVEHYTKNGYVDADEYIILEKNDKQIFINSNKYEVANSSIGKIVLPKGVFDKIYDDDEGEEDDV